MMTEVCSCWLCLFWIAGYLEQSFPSIHNSRLYLDSSRISRTTTKDDHHNVKPLNGSIYYSPGQPPPVPPPPNNALNETSNTSNITSSSHQYAAYFRHGILRSLSLLSILSLLLALNSLYFLLQIVSPLMRKSIWSSFANISQITSLISTHKIYTF